MKANVITMAALVWAASAMAGEWQRPTVCNFQSIEDQTKGYLYNVKTGMFLVNGNDYNTMASLGREGLEVKFEDCSEAQGVNAWQIRFTINNGLLFIGHANGTYYDGELKSSNMGHNYWAITTTADGAYRIAIASNDDTYAPKAEDEAEWFFGWSGDIKADGTLSQTKCVYNVNPEEDGISIDWRVVSIEDYALYAARTALYNLLNEAEEAGVSTDAASTIYNNENATIDEIEEAVASQQEILNNASLMGATDENPVDATHLIKNADCASTDGWEQTTPYGKQGASYSNGDVVISGFLERWVAAGDGSKTLSASTLSQSIKKLPAGRYRLEADAIACNQGNNEPVTGITIFAEFCGERLTRDVNTGNGKPEHYIIDFMLGDVADLTLGFDAAESNTANWIAVDNFRLTYYGLSDNPYYFPLIEGIATLETYEADGAAYWYSAATQRDWAELLERATKAKDGEPEEMQAMAIEIDKFIKVLKVEIDAYAKLQDMIRKVEEAGSTFVDFPTLCDMLAELYENLSDAYDDGAYSVDDIAALDDVYDEVINQGVRADLQPGMDLTVLIKNPDFVGNDNTGWEGTRPSTQHEVGEVWNAGLDMHQTIKNLPAGQYTLRVNAFYRNGTNAEHYADEQLNAVLYGNLQQVKLKSIFSGWMDENVTGGIAFTLSDGTQKYIPNNRESFSLMQDNYPNELKIIVTGDGEDLTFGIKTIGTVPAQSWTCFDNFTLTYDGVDIDGYIGSLREAADALAATRDAKLEAFPLPQDIDNAITTIKDEVHTMNVDGMSQQEATDAVNARFEEINALGTALDSIVGEVQKYQQLVSYYEVAGMEVQDADFVAAFNKSVYNAYTPAATPWIDCEAMAAEQKALKAAWTRYVQSQGDDLSEAIINRGFDDAQGNTTGFGWTYSASGKVDVRVGAMEFWNTRWFNVEQEIVGLRTGYYTVSVTGFYRAGGAAEAAKARTEHTEELNARLFAAACGDTISRPMMSVFDGAPTEKTGSNENVNSVSGTKCYTPNNMETFNEYVALGLYAPAGVQFNSVTFYAEEGQSVNIGIKKDVFVDSDWCIFDNFTLSYVGTSAEGTGVSGTTANAVGLKQEYYTVGGLRLERPQKGINIVRTMLPDGRTVTSKVLVK